MATVQALRAAGYESSHLHEENLQRLADEEILEKARREERIVLTCDLDFGDLLAASGAGLPSVILFRLSNYTPEYLNPRLFQVLAECEPVLNEGAIVIVQDSRYRVRRLPIIR
ncbi:MAG: DUF5615 family PIN-like protein [Fimbriimonadales bacterium]|nr:DUF5615 family PIN-like protein [Fimbriimonadales bacterium]